MVLHPERRPFYLITTPEEEDNLLTTRVYDVADLVVCRDEHDTLSDDYDSLIDIITSTIMPTTWDGVGGPGSIQGNTLGTAKVLVVCQTYHVHSEIAELLAKIREIGKKTPNAGTPHRSKPTPPPQMGLMSFSGNPEAPPARPKAASKKPADAGKPTQPKQPPK